MTAREKTLLVAGLLIGVVVAALAFVSRQYVMSRQEPTAEAADKTTTPSPAAPEQDSNPDSPSSVQLTDDEQRAIGVETTEVKRQTIRREITAPGKVAEPETGIGTISARIGGRIDKLFINVTGETVTRGEPVALI